MDTTNTKRFIETANLLKTIIKPNMKVIEVGGNDASAASGDCGHPLGGTGYLIDGKWVGGHVVDFNPNRLFSYLKRGGLEIKEHISLPVEINFMGRIIVIPKILIPKKLTDFILVVAQK